MPDNKELLRLISRAHISYQSACISGDEIQMDRWQAELRKWLDLIPQLIDYHERLINAPFGEQKNG